MINVQYENGPFYCGLNRILNIEGKYKILFKAPLSTSKDIEVAIKFATRDGLIMEIQNNDFNEGAKQNMFDCSWISRYSEENERLFVANEHKLQIVSIRIIETGTNITLFWKALKLFDYILGGKGLYTQESELTEQNYKCLNSLLCHKLRSPKTNMVGDEYIWNNFNSYLSRKTNIALNMEYLHRQSIGSLFYHSTPKKVKSKMVHTYYYNRYYLNAYKDITNTAKSASTKESKKKSPNQILG